MPSPYLFVAISFIAWVCIAIGGYRIMDDADVLGRGLSERLAPGYRAKANERVRKSFLSAKHRVDRTLVIVGAIVFFGVMSLMFTLAH